jgi:hypothetical protein
MWVARDDGQAMFMSKEKKKKRRFQTDKSTVDDEISKRERVK